MVSAVGPLEWRRTLTEDVAAEGDDRILNDIFDRTSVRTSVMFRLSV